MSNPVGKSRPATNDGWAKDTTQRPLRSILNDLRPAHSLGNDGTTPSLHTQGWNSALDEVLARTDQAEKALTAYVEERLVQELKEALDAISGIGSRGDKVNGNPKFMSGVMATEDYLQVRISELQKGKQSQDKGTATKEEL